MGRQISDASAGISGSWFETSVLDILFKAGEWLDDLLTCDVVAFGGDDDFLLSDDRPSSFALASTMASSCSSRTRILLPGLDLVQYLWIARVLLTIILLRDSILQAPSFYQAGNLRQLLAHISRAFGVLWSTSGRSTALSEGSTVRPHDTVREGLQGDWVVFVPYFGEVVCERCCWVWGLKWGKRSYLKYESRVPPAGWTISIIDNEATDSLGLTRHRSSGSKMRWS